MGNTTKFRAIGLVLGGGIGIAAGAAAGSASIGIAIGGGFGLIAGFAIGSILDRRAKS